MIHTAYTRIIGTAHGTTTTIQAHGATEGTTILGDTATIHGDIDMILGTTVDITEDTMVDITASTTLGITDTTLGTTEDGIPDSMILGIMATQDTTIHSTTICTLTIADGMEHGIHTMEQFTTDLLMAAVTTTSVAAAAQAKASTEDPVTRPSLHRAR